MQPDDFCNLGLPNINKLFQQLKTIKNIASCSLELYAIGEKQHLGKNSILSIL